MKSTIRVYRFHRVSSQLLESAVFSQEIDPLNILKFMLRRWYAILVFSLIGGLLGFGAARILRPEYEASAVVRIGIDYERLDSLTPLQEWRITGTIRALLVSDAILEEVYTATGDVLGGSSFQEFRDSIKLVDQSDGWRLTARGRDPEAAAQVANVWAEATIQWLEEAWEHAWNVSQIQGSMLRIGCEPAPDGMVSKWMNWACPTSAQDIDLESVIDQLQEEIRLSHGIPAAISFEWISQATPPGAPIIWGRGYLILSGAIMGILAAVIFILISTSKADDDTVGGNDG